MTMKGRIIKVKGILKVMNLKFTRLVTGSVSNEQGTYVYVSGPITARG